MTKQEQSPLRRWFEGYIDQFRDRHGVLHPLLELKRIHSLRVAENGRFIAAALGFPEAEQSFAEDCGLVHDVGRFPQFCRFGSFRDADTVDHGAEGRRVLEAQDMHFLTDPGDRERLLCVVQYHNRKGTDIPFGLSPGQDRLLRLTRDADKLDIMELVLNAVASDGFKGLPDMLPHIRLSRELSPFVLKEAAKTKSVSSGSLSTLGDFLVMLVTWFYDLNYPPTLQLAVQRNILARIQRELPDVKEVRGLFFDIEKALLKTGKDNGKCSGKGKQMNDMKSILQDAWERREGPIILSTADKRGVPNAIYATCVKMLDDGSIVVADNYFHKTRTNIKDGSKVAVLFMTQEKKSYQAKGHVEYITEGPIFEDMRQWVDRKHPRIAAAVLHVDALYSGAEKLI